MTNAPKLAWLRKYVDPDLPDIYASGIEMNGCGPCSWKSKIIGGVLNHLGGGVDLEPNGDLHDFRYGTGGTETDRINADIEFYDSIIAWCKAVPWWRLILKFRIRARAAIYYDLVRNHGQQYFKYRKGGRLI
ncbi:hypothetical protein LLG95_11875 [bacterium]|nr:hypothetical protein [bacterium]